MSSLYFLILNYHISAIFLKITLCIYPIIQLKVITLSNHTVFVEESERSVFSRLISQIYLSEATQILVTGPSAGPFYWSDLKEIDESLKPPIDPDSAVKNALFVVLLFLKIILVVQNVAKVNLMQTLLVLVGNFLVHHMLQLAKR